MNINTVRIQVKIGNYICCHRRWYAAMATLSSNMLMTPTWLCLLLIVTIACNKIVQLPLPCMGIEQVTSNRLQHLVSLLTTIWQQLTTSQHCWLPVPNCSMHYACLGHMVCRSSLWRMCLVLLLNRRSSMRPQHGLAFALPGIETDLTQQTLIAKTSELNDRDFIIRNIYKDLYWFLYVSELCIVRPTLLILYLSFILWWVAIAYLSLKKMMVKKWWYNMNILYLTKSTLPLKSIHTESLFYCCANSVKLTWNC